MRALVTGGAGFIGSHLVERLFHDNREVEIIDDLSNANDPFVRYLSLQGWPFIDSFDISEKCPVPSDIEIVFHLAADSIMPTETLELYRRNILGTINLLKEMDQKRVNNLVFASGGVVYGEMKDNDTLKPTSYYGASKLSSEYLISTYARKHPDFKCWIYRFGNVVGSRLNHAVIYDFLKQIKQTGKIIMHGNGEQRRSFIHVSDVVETLITTMSRAPDTYNLCSDDTASVNDVIRVIEESLDKKIEVEKVDPWVWDIQICCPSNVKLKATGWKPSTDSIGAIKRAVSEQIQELFHE